MQSAQVHRCWPHWGCICRFVHEGCRASLPDFAALKKCWFQRVGCATAPHILAMWSRQRKFCLSSFECGPSKHSRPLLPPPPASAAQPFSIQSQAAGEHHEHQPPWPSAFKAKRASIMSIRRPGPQHSKPSGQHQPPRPSAFKAKRARIRSISRPGQSQAGEHQEHQPPWPSAFKAKRASIMSIRRPGPQHSKPSGRAS